MTDATDPFRHHPELRDLIEDPRTSTWRQFSSDQFRRILADHGVDADAVLFPDHEREASHRRFLDMLGHGDLWVFAYGSLMWNPGVFFTDVRRAHAAGFARRMLIKDTMGGRGTADAPGMIAALDTGDGCDGLVFRIDRSIVEEETRIIWKRERALAAYHSVMIPVDTPKGTVTALTFVADHDAELVDDTLSFEDIVRFTATGSGFLGTSLEYVENLCEHLRVLGLDDPHLSRILSAARSFGT